MKSLGTPIMAKKVSRKERYCHLFHAKNAKGRRSRRSQPRRERCVQQKLHAKNSCTYGNFLICESAANYYCHLFHAKNARGEDHGDRSPAVNAACNNNFMQRIRASMAIL
jgi:hypothetical protein